MRFLAAFALLGAVVCSGGCSGRTNIALPGVALGAGEPTEPEGFQFEGKVNVPAGQSFSMAAGAAEEDPPEDQDPAPEPVEDDPPPEDQGEAPPAPPEPEADALQAAYEAGMSHALEVGALAAESLLEMARILAGGAVQPGPDPEPAPEPPAEPPAAPAAAEAEPERPVLREIIQEREGVRRTPYRDLYGYLHIGVGHRMTDEEIGDLYDADLAAAEATAREVVGRSFDLLAWWRQNAWIMLCYWSKCAGFVETIAATRASDWDRAAAEVMDSTLPGINQDRAEEIARWLREGKRGESD